MAYQRALNAWEMGLAGSQAPTPLKRDRQARALLIPRLVAEKAGFFSTEDAPEPEHPRAAAPQPEPPIATPYPEPMAAVTVPSQPDLGTWEMEPNPWEESELDEARSTIQGDPTAAGTFKPLIPRSQWKRAGIVEDERCAA